MQIKLVDASLNDDGGYYGLGDIDFPIEVSGFIPSSATNKGHVAINGAELIAMGGDADIIMNCNYMFKIGVSAVILEVTEIVEAYK